MKAIDVAEAFPESAGGLGWPSEAVRRLDEALNYLLNGVTMIRVEAEEAANSPDCEVTVNPYDVWNVRDNNPHRLGVHTRQHGAAGDDDAWVNDRKRQGRINGDAGVLEAGEMQGEAGEEEAGEK